MLDPNDPPNDPEGGSEGAGDDDEIVRLEPELDRLLEADFSVEADE